MSVGESISNLTGAVANLYREVATTSVRFESLQQHVDQMLGRFERAVQQHDERVQEKAVRQAQIEALEGRLSALSEKALHAAVREAARVGVVRGGVRGKRLRYAAATTRTQSHNTFSTGRFHG